MRVMIIGTGAQGSTVAERLDEDAHVSEVLCVDTDHRAVDELVKLLRKGRAAYADVTDLPAMVELAQGVDLIVNALPFHYALNAMETALAVRANYQDFAATDVLDPWWPRNIEILYNDYGRRFAQIGRLAIIGTGSAPGMMCVAARKAMRELDSCEDILMMVYEGVEAKRFLPFWYSPKDALSDMRDNTFVVENGIIVQTAPFGNPVTRQFQGCAHPVTLVDHVHDETVYMGLNRERHFKGVKNIHFKYAGVGTDFAVQLYRAGLLSKKKEVYHGQEIVPFDFVLSHIPPAPKYRDEIGEIIQEGLVRDEGAFVVEATGLKDGRHICVETYVKSPGLAEAYRRAKLTEEQYVTGNCGALFAKLFADGGYSQKGLISSDMLTEEECDAYIRLAAAYDITLETSVREL